MGNSETVPTAPNAEVQEVNVSEFSLHLPSAGLIIVLIFVCGVTLLCFIYLYRCTYCRGNGRTRQDNYPQHAQSGETLQRLVHLLSAAHANAPQPTVFDSDRFQNVGGPRLHRSPTTLQYNGFHYKRKEDNLKSEIDSIGEEK